MSDAVSEPPAARRRMAEKYAIRGDLPASAIDELRRRHEVWNWLVGIDREYQEAKAAAWEDRPDVAAMIRAVDAAQETADAAVKAQRHARQQARSKAAGAAHATAVREARAALAVAREALKAKKAAEYAPAHSPAKRAIAAAGEARDAAIRGVYAEAIELGLYWGTVLDITDRFRTAAREVSKKRIDGRPARMQFRPWDGTGTLTVPIQRESGVTQAQRDEIQGMRERGLSNAQIGEIVGRSARTVARILPEGPEKHGDPPCTTEVLASGEGKWRNSLQLSPQLPEDFAALPRSQRRQVARGGEVAFRIGSAEKAEILRLPVTIHRPPRGGAEVVLARITRTRTGPDARAHLSLGVSVPAPPARTEGGTVLVHTGWRVLADRSLRVAVISGAGDIPAGLAATGTARGHGSWTEIVIPAGWRDEMSAIEAIQGRRGKALDELRGQLISLLEEHPGAREVLDPEGTMARWRSPGRFARLALDHRDSPPPGCEQIAAAAEEWRAEDLADWRREARKRKRLLGRRDNAWRNVAAWVVASAAVVAVDSWEIPARRHDDDPVAVAAASANRVLAAPGYLRERITSAAGLAGVTVAEPGTGAGPQVHAACGRELDAEARKRGLLIRCGCGREVDQDLNTLALMARALREG